MNKCVLIVLSGNLLDENVQSMLKKEASKAGVEGIAQVEIEGHIKIIANGSKEAIEQFIDVLYKDGSKYELRDILVEPFFKNKDFRGVFRIILT